MFKISYNPKTLYIIKYVAKKESIDSDNEINPFYGKLDFCYGTVDSYCASILKMSFKEYQKFMLNNFNCYVNHDTQQIYFASKEDAKLALDWANAKIMMEMISTL